VKEIADGVYQLSGFPPNAINVFLMNGVIVDASTKYAKRRILRQVKGHDVTAHALTHAHPDHQGASHAVCEELGLPLWVGANDADAMEDGRIAARQPGHILNRMSARFWAGPPHPVARRLAEGNDVGSFTALDTPGHSAGHVAYWREGDRTLILGDVLFGCHPSTGMPGFHEPPEIFTPDPQRNRQSARRLAELEPALVCFGHGPPSRDTRGFLDFVAGLPR
jgi:glyoxylase-like metal-dependent hydrolase (beta-lactamase superfamily II)